MKHITIVLFIIIGVSSCRALKTNVSKTDKISELGLLKGTYKSDSLVLDDGNTGVLIIRFDSLEKNLVHQYLVTSYPASKEFDSIVMSDTTEYNMHKNNEFSFLTDGVRPGNVKYSCLYHCKIDGDSLGCYLEIKHEGWLPFFKTESYFKE